MRSGSRPWSCGRTSTTWRTWRDSQRRMAWKSSTRRSSRTIIRRRTRAGSSTARTGRRTPRKPVPLSLAVAFSMIASYLLSSSLVPVFSAWLMKEGHRGEEREGLFGHLRGFYLRYLAAILRFRWPLVLLYLVSSAALLTILVPRMGTEIFPDVDAPILRIRLRAPAGTRVEESERQVLRSLDVIRRDIGGDNIEITSDFVGVVPSSYPVNLIHLFTDRKSTRLNSSHLGIS